MALKDLATKKVEIETLGGTFAVRGLTLPDILKLTTRYKDQLESVFEKAVALEKEKGGTSVADQVIMVTAIAPGLIGSLVALAADEPDSEEIAAGLDLGTQIYAIENILELTFATAGGPKKAFEIVLRAMQNVPKALPTKTA